MEIARFLVAGFAILVLASGASADAERMDAPEAEPIQQMSTATAPITADARSGVPGAAEPEVARALLTRGIHEREPIDQVDTLGSNQKIVYFFTDLRNLQGVTITHRWELEGLLMAEVPFTVGAARWRVWSSKNLVAESVGNWVVSVVGSAGQVLESTSFSYSATAADPPTSAE